MTSPTNFSCTVNKQGKRETGYTPRFIVNLSIDIQKFFTYLGNFFRRKENYFPVYAMLKNELTVRRDADDAIRKLQYQWGGKKQLDRAIRRKQVIGLFIDLQEGFTKNTILPDEKRKGNKTEIADGYKNGGLPVANARHAAAVANRIAAYIKAHGGVTIFTADHHPENHVSFAPTGSLHEYIERDGTKNTYVKCENKSGNRYALVRVGIPEGQLNIKANWMKKADGTPMDPQSPWDKHCVQKTGGAKISAEINHRNITHIVCKGTEPREAYSAFTDELGFTSTNLDDILQSYKYTEKAKNSKIQKIKSKIFFPHIIGMGIATDYCVHGTLMHARNGTNESRTKYDVTFLEAGSVGIDFPIDNIANKKQEMRDAGICVLDKN